MNHKNRLKQALKKEITIDEICFGIRNFEGVTRKRPIADISDLFDKVRDSYGSCIADIGDDAAVIDINTDQYLLLAADGIWGRLIEKSPWWAGYAAVLSNINDIYAMGGKPIAMVDIVSAGDTKTLKAVVEGMVEGVRKFNVPVVGGHTHPDPGHASVSIGILGLVDKNAVIKSSTAHVGDNIVAAIDLDGRTGPNSVYSWETTSHKSPQDLKKLYGSIEELGKKRLLTSGKDISNPGLIGTLGMLCEASCKGAVVDIEKIPYPAESNIPAELWLMIHPGTGFVMTLSENNTEACLDILKKGGFDAAVIGTITDKSRVDIVWKNETRTVFDLNKEPVAVRIKNIKSNEKEQK